MSMRSPPRGSAGRAPAASVPARDAATTIGASITALLGAGPDPRGVTVVDDGSRDGRARIVAAAGADVVARPGGVGAASARNLGAVRSSVPVLVFADADVRVAPDAIARRAEALAGDGAPAAAFGPCDDAPPAAGLVGRVRSLLYHQIHPGPDGTFRTGSGDVWRDPFEAVRGSGAGQRMMEDGRLGQDLRRADRRIEPRPDIEGARLERWTLGSVPRTDLLDRAVPWSRRPGGARTLPLR